MLTFQPELGISTATLAPADRKLLELQENSGAQHYPQPTVDIIIYLAFQLKRGSALTASTYNFFFWP
jgi:hypothetical protein